MEFFFEITGRLVRKDFSEFIKSKILNKIEDIKNLKINLISKGNFVNDTTFTIKKKNYYSDYFKEELVNESQSDIISFNITNNITESPNTDKNINNLNSKF